MMQYVRTAGVIIQTALLVIRNLYITVMFLPLWLWSAAYRYEDEFAGTFRWLNASWSAFSILALLYGAFGLWFFAEKAVETHYSGKPSKGLVASVWAVAITLFVACLGAAIDQGNNGWGKGLFIAGIDALPLILLFCIQAYSMAEKKTERAVPEPAKHANDTIHEQLPHQLAD
jgi:general stress protein CsbA